jgi:hypothetical protein
MTASGHLHGRHWAVFRGRRHHPNKKGSVRPAIRVTYSENALTADQKAELAPLLIDAVMLQEVNPITEAARHITAACSTRFPSTIRLVLSRSGWSRR